MFDPLLLSLPTGRRSAELKPLLSAFASALETQRRAGNTRLYAAECGVWKGESLILCARAARALGVTATIFGLDTFCGLPKLGPRDLEDAPRDAPYRERQWFADTSLKIVQLAVEEAGLAGMIQLVPGLFSDTLSSLPDGPYCFVNVDCDLYEPHIECLDHFLPRMAPGGIIYFDDFHSEDFPMAREAIKDFLAAHKELELVHVRFGDDKANRMKSLIIMPDSRRRTSKPKAASQASPNVEANPAEISFEHISWYLARSADKSFPLRADRPDAIVLQMGKVAPSAIYRALARRGFNVFHCHGLSEQRQQQNLTDVLRNKLTPKLTGRKIRQHLYYLALHMMVRWYQLYQQRRGEKLKIISLARDPVSRYGSVLMQDLEQYLPRILKWQRRRLAMGTDAAIDRDQAIEDFVTELVAIVARHAPLDRDACRACANYAKKRWPEDSIVVAQLRQLLLPLTWFDTEMASIFGFDVLSGTTLRDKGWSEFQNDWSEILVLRYEALGELLPEVRRFFGISDLVLECENVTEQKPYAAATSAATAAAFSGPLGQQAVQALRSSVYGRACGYDLLETPKQPSQNND